MRARAWREEGVMRLTPVREAAKGSRVAVT